MRVPIALKDLTPAYLLALSAAVVGLLISYGLITNHVEQLWTAIASVAIPSAFLIGKAVLDWRHATAVSVLAVVTAVVGFLVQAGFIDSAHAKQLVGAASAVVPVVIILVHTLAAKLSPEVVTRNTPAAVELARARSAGF